MNEYILEDLRDARGVTRARETERGRAGGREGQRERERRRAGGREGEREYNRGNEREG